MTYIGRFAPSPTGPLHFGSLITALASFLDARKAGGLWLLRIEDLDPQRESRDAPAQIISQLSALGLTWDKDILYQSTRLKNYEKVLNRLRNLGAIYPCICSRKSVPSIYKGTCRAKKFEELEVYSIRLKVNDQTINFNDQLLGPQRWSVKDKVGDFIIRRKDGLFAYQLAVVVDDDFQGVNKIVRGGDLLSSTPRQLAIYNILGLYQPEYLHVPVIVDANGDKLSKQANSKPLVTSNPLRLLRHALTVLGQNPQKDVSQLSDLIDRAIKAWRVELIPASTRKVAPQDYLH